MKINIECIPCAVDSLVQLARKGIIPEDKQEETMRALLAHLAQLNYQQSPPELGQQMHRLIRDIIQNPDPYLAIKKQFNDEMLSRYPEFQKMVEDSANPFDTALRLAIAGNIIDFGPKHEFTVDATIRNVLKNSFAIDHSNELKQAIKQAKSILYLGDNAGEIVLDRLFLETIRHPNVYFAVRGAPIINDATIDDAQKAGIDKHARIISNGSDAPSTILADTSDEFQALFSSVDLIISKGQGNFEGLTGGRFKIFFLLMVKCQIIAKIIGVPKGSFVVIQN